MSSELERKTILQQIDPESFSLFQKLSERFPSPRQIQELLRRDFTYNDEPHGESVASARVTWERKTAHCFEASMLCAAILEPRGYPPLVLSLESQDGMDHVLFVFKEKGLWGAVSRSREDGLHGRAPVFRSLRDLARSYAEPYIDDTSRLTGYAIAHLDDTGTAWRASPRNLWKAERYLIDLPHQKLITSDRRFEERRKIYKDQPAPPQPHWW